MDTSSDFKALQDAISAALVSTTRSASRLAAEDLGFHRSLDPAIGTRVDRQNARLLALAERLLSASASVVGVEAPKLPDVESIDNSWKGIVDVTDGLLERVDTCLDEFSGLVKRYSSPAPSAAGTTTKQKPRRNAQSFRNLNIPKPQRTFEHVPTNNESAPFIPLLTSKPNATMPLEESIRRSGTAEEAAHPYQTEIEQYDYPNSVYTPSEPLKYAPFESTSPTFVDSLEGVNAMLQELKSAAEIAIDLEHHDTHSYIGLVSLMQISTRNRDWIVDTLKPWRRKLECLNEVFTDPSILKVFHGAHMDMIWLQRDLGLYVVGLFDTHHAARVLGYTGGSLAFLLKKFIDFDAQKQYQLADWRVRPLPAELVDYARSDTHFLLYIYDNMRNELIDRSQPDVEDGDLIQSVLERSKLTSLQRYEHPIYDPVKGSGSYGWFNMLQRTPMLMTKEQFAVFRAVHKWRDTIARQEDEGLQTVLPNHAIFNIIRDIPEAVPHLLSSVYPLSSILRTRASELLAIIRKACTEDALEPETEAALTETCKALGLTKAFQTSASTNQQLANQTEIKPEESNSLPLRSTSSIFWGSIGLARPEPRVGQPLPFLEDIVLSLGETSSTFQTDPSVQTTTATAVEPAQETNASSDKKRSDMQNNTSLDITEGFTNVKQLHQRKRKSEAISGANGQGTVEDGDEKVMLESEDLKALQKAERKAARKARKAAKHGSGEAAMQSIDSSSISAGDGATVFNYANAPSVFNGPAARDSAVAAAGKAFNPYARSLEAPAGLKRVQGSNNAGKSTTWSSRGK